MGAWVGDERIGGIKQWYIERETNESRGGRVN